MGVQSMDFSAIADSCSSISTLASSFEGTIDTMTSAAGKVQAPAWEGDAAESFRGELTNLVNKLPTAKEQLAYSVLYLTSVSDGYEELGETTVNKLIEMVGGQSKIDSMDVSGLPDPDLTLKSEKKAEDPEGTYGDDQDKNGKKDDDPGNTGPRNTGPSYTGPTDPGGNGADDGTVTMVKSERSGKEVSIPSDVKQGGYTVTGYDYWINTGKEMTWKDGTDQKTVSEVWKKQGSNFKNGIAQIKVDGTDRYVLALSSKFGKPGDCVDITLSDGKVIHAIIGDQKGSDAGSEWGHKLNDGSINILEFEVKRETFLSKGNPATGTWGLEWDSSKDVTSIKNLGSIIGATTNK